MAENVRHNNFIQRFLGYFHNGAKLFNELPQNIRDIESIDCFKKKCKEFVKKAK